MPNDYTQDRRLVRLTTVLGGTALIAQLAKGKQAMSTGFRYTVTTFSDSHHDLSPSDLVGTAATISIVQTDNSLQFIHGYISDLTPLGSLRAGQLSQYALTLVSWPELFAAEHTNCRIFQDKPVDTVINTVLAPYLTMGRVVINLSQPHSSQRLWVQYNESDWNFVKRLCQLEGLAFYFSHDKNGHQLHIVDSANGLSVLSPKQVPLQSGTLAHDHLTGWQNGGRFATGTFEQRAYNYKTPQQPVVAKATTKATVAETPRVLAMESYLFGETHHTIREGNARLTARANQSTERSQVATGKGNCRHLTVGKHFEVALAPGSNGLGGQFVDKGKTFTLTQVRIEADNETGTFSCDIEALPRGELVYPQADRATITCLQTAVVTGPEGEEVFMDSEGRIKVQFHWDREGKHNQDTTCWLRVMQSLAGPGFGTQFTPRIGQEVVVAFENSNPDRPVVIGGIYHPENPPPYGNDKGSRNGFRTRSTKGGGSKNYNELFFEDKKGQEQVYLQAEKDHNHLVKHDQTATIRHNKDQEVGNNHTNKVGDNYIIDVGECMEVSADTEIKLQVGSTKVDINGGKITLN